MVESSDIPPAAEAAETVAAAQDKPKRRPSLAERVIERVGEELSPDEQILDDGTLISSHILRLVSRRIVAGIPFDEAYLDACRDLKPLFLSGRIGADAPIVNEIIDTGPDDLPWGSEDRALLLDEIANVRIFARDNFLSVLDGKEEGRVSFFDLDFPFAEPVYTRIAFDVAERTADREMVSQQVDRIEAPKRAPKAVEHAPIDYEFFGIDPDEIARREALVAVDADED